MRGAGIEPAVKSIGLLGEVGAAAVRALEADGQDICRFLLEPCVGAFLFKQARDGFNALLGADGLFAVLAIEHGDGQTPAALTGDAPVLALADHRAHAVLAPRGQPADVLAGGDGLVLKGVDRAEPLRGGAEDDGALAAPAVRIAVDDLFRSKENAAFLHIVKDDGV